jgi:hypothetical protein
VLAAVAQNGDALGYASESLQHDKQVVLAAVAQNGNALCYASESLQQHRALQQISTGDLALEASKLRLVLASCLLPNQPANGAPGLSALSRDVVELTSASVSRGAVVRGLACRHHYWDCVPANNATTLAASNPAFKKRKVM